MFKPNLTFNLTGVTCNNIWTGGRSSVAGSPDITDWRWYYSNNFTAASEPFTYVQYGTNQPNNYLGSQFYMGLDRMKDNDFNDFPFDMSHDFNCFLCECN